MTQPSVIGTFTLLDAATATGAGSTRNLLKKEATFQAFGTTASGSGAATILIQVSNDGTNWITAGTITLTLGTAATNDGFASDAKWTFVRANVTALSGTGASVTVLMGY